MLSKNKRQLSFLIISHDTYPPSRTDVTVLIGKYLVAFGHNFDWILMSNDSCDKPYVARWNGGNVWVGKNAIPKSIVGKLKRGIESFINEMKLFSLLRAKSYDFIQVKDKFLVTLPAVIAAKKNKVQFVYWLSFPYAEFYLSGMDNGVLRCGCLLRGVVLWLLTYRIILPSASHVFVQSQYMKEAMIKKGVPESKLTAVPMGVPVDDIPFDPGQSSGRVTHKIKNVMYLGTLNRSRRLDFLIRTFSSVLCHEPNATLHLVGGGESPGDEELLWAEAERLSIRSKVTITGFMAIRQAWEYLRSADVCVSPIYPCEVFNYGTPTKIIEYMAMGKAVVANEHPDQSDVIARSGAGLCVRWDEMEFSDAIASLLRNPGLCYEMGCRGREYVKKYRDYRSIAETVERQYLAIANGTP